MLFWAVVGLAIANFAPSLAGIESRHFFGHQDSSSSREVYNPWFNHFRRDRSDSASHEYTNHRRRQRFDCGGPAFRLINFGPRRSFCCGGLFYDDVADSMQCCGVNIYDHRLYSCNGGVSIVPMFQPSYEVDLRAFKSGRYGSGNARVAFDLNEAPKHAPFKCGNNIVPAHSQFDLCCDGQYFPNPHQYFGCCGNRCFDSRYYRCSPQRQIIDIDAVIPAPNFHHHQALYRNWPGVVPVRIPPPVFIGKELHSAEIVQPQKQQQSLDRSDNSRFDAVEHLSFANPNFRQVGVPGLMNYQGPHINWNQANQNFVPPPAPVRISPPRGETKSQNVPDVQKKLPNFRDPFSRSVIEDFVPHVLSMQNDAKRAHH